MDVLSVVHGLCLRATVLGTTTAVAEEKALQGPAPPPPTSGPTHGSAATSTDVEMTSYYCRTVISR